VIAELILCFIVGAAIGAIYFAGLWETVRKLSDTNKPFRRVVISFALRMILLISGLYLVMQGQWERLVAAMIGLILVREVMVRKLGNASNRFFGGISYGNRRH
jgi:F1F0 ATPase subunit 2